MLDSGTKPPESRIHLFDPVGLLNDGYGCRASNYAVRPRRPTKSYDNFIDTTNNTTGGLRSYDSFSLRSYDSFSSDTNGGVGLKSYDHSNHVNRDVNNGGLRFGVDSTVEDDSDVPTPRLWKPSSPTSLSVNSSPLHPDASPKSVKFSPPMSVSSSPVHPNHNHYHAISPNSRTQAIAKGRRELMEMVRDLPESFYELSLKDLVEQKPDMEVQKEMNLPEDKKPVAVIKETTKVNETKKQLKKSSSKKVRKSESRKKMVRSTSVDNGKFLLKTSVFPIFMGSKKNKKNLGGSSSFKVAPVPKPQPIATGTMKGVEKDWWRRKSCISSESDESNGLSSNSASSSSSTSSSSSNSSNGRRSNRFIPSCCFFNGRRIRGRK